MSPVPERHLPPLPETTVPVPSTSAWRKVSEAPPLAEVFRSIPVGQRTTFQKFLAFLGPGYIVAVGYMDPGNWATALAGGSQFGYQLLFVAVLSNFMAIVLQSLCARLAVGSGRDLAQACRDAWPRPVAWGLWILAEVAIIATDLAEVIGTAIGLQLVFGIPMTIGVFVTALDVFVILLLQSLGFRWIEAFIITLLGVIAACFGIQVALAQPDWAAAVHGFVPSTDLVTNPAMLYIGLGIVGATVMPHNLYLHSAIVQTRAYGESYEEKREALKFATLDSTIALMAALFINAAILILAAASFHAHGRTDVIDIGQAHALLTPLLGSGLAPVLFGIALLACGLNSAVTATLAGQAVMEGFINIRLRPWLRRAITRLIAIVPAVVVTLFYGESATTQLLILSQVVLSLQLPFAVVPLVWLTADRRRLGAFTSPSWLTLLSGTIAAIIIALNLKLLSDTFFG